MSEFKFACPVCGQHITADSKAAGSQLECPTCFRKIVVPQAPSSADPKFILSATTADKPRPTQAAAGPSSLGTRQSRPRRTTISVGFLLLLVVAAAGATVFLLRDQIFQRIRGSSTADQAARIHGAIGLGAWNTRVEYTDLIVTKGTRTLYRSRFTNGAPGWQVFRGNWFATNGVFAQTAIATDCHATAGDVSWSGYTLRLRARKLGGREGFLIMFNVVDDRNWTWLNLGGWNNTRTAVEHCVGGAKSTLGSYIPGHIENGRWYDVRIELDGPHIRCYLDNELIEDVRYPSPEPSSTGSARGAAALPSEPLTANTVASGSWRANLSGAAFPERDAAGQLLGSAFGCEGPFLQGRTPYLRQGRSWPSSPGVSAYLPPKDGASFNSQSVKVTTLSAVAPLLVVRRKEKQQPVTESYHRGCVMKLECERATGNRIPGRIYLCMSDESKSYVAGTFDTEVRKPSSP